MNDDNEEKQVRKQIFAAKQGDFSSELALIIFLDGLIWRGMDAALQMMKTHDAARL